MATLSGSTIASTYDRLLALPSGGLNGTTLVAITDGNASATCALQVATTKINIKPASATVKVFEVQESDATPMLSVDETATTTKGVVVNETGQADIDFRVEASSITHALFVDGTQGNVGIGGTTSPSNWGGVPELVLEGTQPLIHLNDTSGDSWAIVTDASNFRIYNDTDSRADMSIDGDGDVVISHTVGINQEVAGTGHAPNLQSHGTSNGGLAVTGWNATNTMATSPKIWLSKNGGATVGTHAQVASNEVLGTILFSGSDGNDFVNAASIHAIAEASPGSNDMPGALIFSTTADGGIAVAEHMRIDNAGNVGIGTDDPDNMLHIMAVETSGSLAQQDSDCLLVIEDNGSTGIEMITPNNAYGRIIFSDGSARGKILYFHNDNSMQFGTSGDIQMTIASAGDVTFTGDLIMADGKGIDFSNDASPAAGMTAEILDDYEEGTWTPILGGAGGTSGQSYSATSATYTKIGRMVYIMAYINLDTVGTITGAVEIQGFPFTSANNNASIHSGTLGYDSVFDIDADHMIAVEMPKNDTTATIYMQQHQADAPATLAEANVTTGALQFYGAYYV